MFGQIQSNMKLEKSFGETIKKLREEKDLPLREVAEAVRIDTSMLGKIEKNNRRPTKNLVEKLAKYFCVSEKDLLIALISDSVVKQVLYGEDLANEVLKVAEKKVKYLRTIKSLKK